MKKYFSSLIVFFLIIFIIVCSPVFSINLHQPDYFPGTFVTGEIMEVIDEQLHPDPVLADRKLGTQYVKLKICNGMYKGKTFELSNPLSSEHYVLVKPGMKVIINLNTVDGKPEPWIYSYNDDLILIGLVGIFFVLMLLLGRSQGLKSILSLVFTGVVIIFIMLPLIFQGYNPPLTAILVASLSTIVTFTLIGGWHFKSLASILGTIAGIIIAGFISWGAGKLAHLSGITMENSQQLLFIAQDYRIQIKGLMFAAILISSLGAIMDVAMSVASATFEMHQLNPRLKSKELLRSSMNVGKDMMGTMSNTLILTFAGGSLNTMMLIWGYQMHYNQFINIALIKTEIIQSLAGSIGIILTVPLTAVLSVYFTTLHRR